MGLSKKRLFIRSSKKSRKSNSRKSRKSRKSKKSKNYSLRKKKYLQNWGF